MYRVYTNFITFRVEGAKRGSGAAARSGHIRSRARLAHRAAEAQEADRFQACGTA
jgi:hypothetical protein